MELQPIAERIRAHQERANACIAVEWAVEDLYDILLPYREDITSLRSDDDSIFLEMRVEDFEKAEASLIPFVSSQLTFLNERWKWQRKVSEAEVKWSATFTYGPATLYTSIRVQTSDSCSVTLIPTGRTKSEMCWKEIPVYDYQISCPELEENGI